MRRFILDGVQRNGRRHLDDLKDGAMEAWHSEGCIDIMMEVVREAFEFNCRSRTCQDDGSIST